MNLEQIRQNVIKAAQNKLNRHKSLGSNTNLSINQVAELLDIVSGRANEIPVSADQFIGNYSLN
ncbi:MAG: hypothetical protein ABJG68_10050 [Crocinitomicaceae bacterium]